MMSNEEFDNLKQELIWEGSKVAVLSSAEQARPRGSATAPAPRPLTRPRAPPAALPGGVSGVRGRQANTERL